MNAEFFAALDELEKERHIPKEYMISKISQALLNAYKKDQGPQDNVFVTIDEKKGELKMYLRKLVVEEVTDPRTEISEAEAREISKKSQIGDFVNIEIKTRDFGRIAAKTARDVITQGIKEAEKMQMYEDFTSREHEILSATVSRVDDRTGDVFLDIAGKTYGSVMLPVAEQISGEKLVDGEMVKVYLVDVKKNLKGELRATISRTHPGLVKRLFELEVPELKSGVVELRSIAREAGSRTKIAVLSNDPEVDPVGACIGPMSKRVSSIVAELGGEKIDIIKFSPDPAEFIGAALAPADTIAVEVAAEGKSCRVTVPDDQLSLAIGKEGQNARLAAKLTGYKIDIKPLSAPL